MKQHVTKCVFPWIGGKEMKECTVICNTRWGYCMTPKKCKSIAEAIRYAKEMEMAFRIFVNGKCIKSGWYK